MAAPELHDGRPLVFVTVGTDHHRFDRLMAWVDEWMIEGGGAQRARVFVQAGTSTAPRHAASAELVPRGEMERFVRDSAAVVCHGGPASISECRRAGVLPIVVPRLHMFHEHVDDHQVMFTGRLAALGKIRLADSSAQLAELLDSALASPEAFRLPPGPNDVEAAIAEFGRVVATLFTDNDGQAPTRRRRRPRRRRPMPDTLAGSRIS
jgi:UDP-N-acetylglucosamine transferase subunit ALG13